MNGCPLKIKRTTDDNRILIYGYICHFKPVSFVFTSIMEVIIPLVYWLSGKREFEKRLHFFSGQ